MTRAHPEYEPPNIHLGGFIVDPTLDQSLFYNSNLNGTPGGSGTFGSNTAVNLAANSNWDRNSLGGSLGFSHNQYFSLPNESYTDWHLGLAGGYTIGDSMLSLDYYHLSFHQLGSALASVQSETPVSNQLNTVLINYTFNLGRFAVTPEASFTAYRFGSATVGGAVVDQGYLDHTVVAGGATARYSMSDEGSIVVVTRATRSSYPTTLEGQPSNDSTSFILLGGIDYQPKSVWRYQLLVGVEHRSFDTSTVPARTAAIAQGNIIWQPTELTTVTGSLSRMIEDPQSAGTSGYVLTQAQLKVDHELRRNILLEFRAGVQHAAFLQGGDQSDIIGGASITWLINRHLRLSLDYTFLQQTGGNVPTGVPTNTSLLSDQFAQTVVGLTLHVAY